MIMLLSELRGIKRARLLVPDDGARDRCSPVEPMKRALGLHNPLNHGCLNA